MKILYAGTPSVAVPPLVHLAERPDVEIVAVLTRTDAPVGRKKVLTPSPVAEEAGRRGLPVLKANRVDAELTERIRGLGADVAAVVAYGALVPQAALDAVPHGWINLHFSLLPQWRGAAPVQRALMAGDTVVGASTFLLEAGLDTGPVLGTMTDEVRPDDTAGTVLERLSRTAAPLLADSLRAVVDGSARPAPQQGDVTHAPKLTAEDGRVRWSDPAVAVAHRVRGATPEPGAWTRLDERRLKLDLVLPRPDVRDLAPGRCVLRGDAVLVGTGSYAVQLTRVQPAGKKTMEATAWARGRSTEEEVVFQ
ncbi:MULTISPECIES: methionyl-tRNA formyltransferase [Kocuria]|uniref:methionyl-tRNA formyltransferase n=1 Tax=Kocuria TaxID=57493 RepID=UPI00036117A2|nr:MULTISPECIES: methionyl-tRNA formyltransferase [Kocuria]NVC23710.1 methionyl-tRNA formyltransferase [Kocuria salina]EYT49682.1 methionyl-tRNA formyltransferase [Kocuria sp. UCD-OTCP]MCM3486994.1 methionyl-tRNA formyltransferase [Kocuria rosea]MEB2527726.1 methionyl-tRNA formyltransferase [Kocuria rosea]MEB2618053.1 methionyl-tRNA formyltransferase [Kocuria rosea]